ncbi:XkdX family protein [Saccharibacillus brassicae]|uniref:XkdX family protein n=1 Tax=Saccharibacillus brassicae TaxID=2583377 RepID=A0A4Y6UPJ1_SACBS|nr:XkdX family protein [Saccharibacillus brassicae]QDH19552.1 XkdX family protein [Saccharibacillus brassicae]
MFESDFDRLSYYYKCKWAREPQLRQYVSFGVITPEEYEKIVGQKYE